MAEECTCDSKLEKLGQKLVKIEETEAKLASLEDELWSLEIEYESILGDYEEFLFEKESPSEGEEGELCLEVDAIVICYPPYKAEDFAELEEKIEEFQEKLEKLEKKIKEKEEKIDETQSKLTTAQDDLDDAEFEFQECENKLITTYDGETVKKDCAMKCKGCGNYFSSEAFDPSIEAWELLNQ